MKRLLKLSLILTLFIVPAGVFGQIYEPEGVNVPGEWNGWTNSNDTGTMGNFRMAKRAFAGGQYMTTLNITGTEGDTTAGTYQWLFTSGPSDDLYRNKWANASPINIDGFTPVVHQGGTNNSITVENGFYYTIILDDNGYADSEAAVFKTSTSPVSITSLSGVPTTEVTENTPVTITVELDKAKSAEEKVYLRYSTDEFQTSNAIEITNFSGGTTGTAEIPGQPMNASVEFYVLTTTIDEADWNGKTDLATIRFDNNGGTNYSYYYEANVSPVNGSEGISTTPELSWYMVDNQAGYDLQVDNNSDFSSPVVDESGLTTLSYSITTPLDINTNYYWRFKGDTATTWSDTFSFKTETAITFANVQFPESAVLDEGGSATIYGQLYVPSVTALDGASDDISAWIGINQTNENPENWDEQSWTTATYNATSTTAGDNDEYQSEVGSSLSPGTYYYAYRYQYLDQDSVFGVIGGIWDDTTQTLGELVIKDTPELNAPANEATDVALEPELSWTIEDANIAQYNLQVSESVDFSSTVINEADLSSASTTYSVGSGVLDYETTYYWRARTEYDTTTSAWSQVFSFSTLQSPPAQITLTTPADAAENISQEPEFTWQADAKAATYELLVSTDTTFADGAQTAIAETGLTATNFTVPEADSLNRDTNYFWRVRGVNSTGNGAWSQVFSFTTAGNPPAKIVLNQPADAATGIELSPMLEWQADANAASYELQVSEESSFATPELIAVDETGIAETTFTVPDGEALDIATQYFWRVRGTNSVDNGPWSDTLSFTTLVPEPQLDAPAHEAVDVSKTPVLSWFNTEGAQHYDVQVAPSASFTDLVVDETSITDSSFTVPALDYDSTYYWRVRVQVNDIQSDWSAANSFMVQTAPPAKITAATPADGSTEISTQPAFEWEADAKAASYELQVSEEANFSTAELIAVNKTGLGGNSYTLTSGEALKEATPYYWRVRGVNGTGSGAWSDTLNFSTTVPVPQLDNPADEAPATPINPLLAWLPVDGAQHYDVQLAPTSSFSNPILDTTSVADTSLVANGLEYTNTYYWRVRVQVNDLVSNWSAPFSFTVKNTPPPFPVLISPDSGAVDVSLNPTLVWEASSGAASYEIEVATQSDFGGGMVFDTAGYTGTNLELSNLTRSTTYHWRVRATNSSNEIGQWSVPGSFTTIPEAPAAITALAPGDSLIDLSTPVTFTWSESENASAYEFQFSDSETFSFSSDTSLTDTTLTLAKFTSGSGYYWRVRAANAGGESDWTATRYFEMGVGGFAGPDLLTPEHETGDTGTEVVFEWKALAAADAYQLQVAEADAFETTVEDTTGIEGTQYTLVNLEEGSTYFWRVRALDSNSSGQWSAVNSFTTKVEVPGAVTTVAPADSAADVSLPVTFSWNPAEGGEAYEFKLSEQAGFSISIDSTVSDTSLTLSSLSYNTPYYWQVRGVNTAGGGAWSPVQYFTTTIQMPGVPELVNPEDGEEVQASVRFGWNEAAHAESYHLQVAKSENFESPDVDSASITGLTLEVSGFEEGTTYFWRVRAVNRVGQSAWSAALSFTTETLTSMESEIIPDEFALYPNYPNPFNPTTTLQYDVKEAGEVKIRVFDISGRLIQTLVNERKNSGRYKVTFDAGSLASGLYLVRMEAPGYIQIRKMTLIK